ncbi:MAG: PASTA domain-containing protein [Dysgonomonas sp.]
MKKQNFLSRFLANVYVKNLLLMAAVGLVLIIIVLTALRFYTKHNESITVPSVKGLQAEEAMNILHSSGLGYEISDSVYQAEGVPGSVIEQVPIGESNVKKGRTIFLIVKARGVQMIAIPELKDVSRRQAEAQLNSLGFTRITIEEVPAAYKGLVISVSYRGKNIAPGQKIPKGASLVLTVGAGGEILQEDSVTESQPVEESFFE